ncbi:MAG: hypothetical protein FWG97_00270 [Deltaproteobacteria bacterium]|nr:hypothetical protein [Deltaproteobacteria bacterium]
MFFTFDEASKKINEGALLHIAGTEALLRKLPKGRWIGGSTEYFMTKEGGKVLGDHLLMTEFPYESFSIKSYSVADIENVAVDAYNNGFSILVAPFDSAVHKKYANNAADFKDMFLKNIAGWIAGVNLNLAGQSPVAVDGQTAETFVDRAVALHCKVPDNKTVNVNIVNIFTPDENSPVIEFQEEGFTVTDCLVDGRQTALADYIAKNRIDTKLPMIGDYAGNGINVSFKSIENGAVSLYSSVFSGIKYRMAKSISDYAAAFHSRLAELNDANIAFSCNCILNFLYGELEGKTIGALGGPITFGEIAYQLLNQTLVYVTVTD